MRLHPMRTKPARQPEAVSTGFEGQCNPRDLAAGLDHLVAPAMQQAKKPFCTRLQLLARLTLNAGKHTGNQQTRLAHLDDGNDCAILVQGDEGSAQVVWLGHRGTPSVHAATMVPSPRRLPHSISRSRCEEQRRRSVPLRTGIRPSRYGSTRGPYYGSNSPGEPCSGGGRCAHFADRVPRPKVTLAANSARPRPGRSEVEASTGLDESAGR